MNGDVKVKYQNLPSKGGDALSDYLEDDEAWMIIKRDLYPFSR